MYNAKRRVTIQQISCYYYLKNKLVLCSLIILIKPLTSQLNAPMCPAQHHPAHVSANPIKLRAFTKHYKNHDHSFAETKRQDDY